MHLYLHLWKREERERWCRVPERISKVKPITCLLHNPRYTDVLGSLGASWDVPDELAGDLETFTCVMYRNSSRCSSVEQLRHQMLKERCGEKLDSKQNVDFLKISPCKRSLLQHIKGSNYQVAIWGRAHVPLPDIPDAWNGHGWVLSDGHLQPFWSEEPVVELDLLEEILAQPLLDELPLNLKTMLKMLTYLKTLTLVNLMGICLTQILKIDSNSNLCVNPNCLL